MAVLRTFMIGSILVYAAALIYVGTNTGLLALG